MRNIQARDFLNNYEHERFLFNTLSSSSSEAYQTLPNPKKYGKSKSDSKMSSLLDASPTAKAALAGVALLANKEKDRASSVIDALTPSTLTRTRSLRKAKV